MDVPSFLYNPVESVQNTLSEANMPQTDIDAFISNPTVEALEQYTTSEQLVAKNGETVTRTVIANTNKQPYELVNALKIDTYCAYFGYFLNYMRFVHIGNVGRYL